MSKYTIVVGSLGEINCCIGIFDSEQTANKKLKNLQTNWWNNGESYSGIVIPLNLESGD